VRIEVKQRKTTFALLCYQAEARVANEVIASEEESQMVAVIMKTYRRG